MSRTALRVASLAALVILMFLASACDKAPPPPTVVVTVAPELAAVDPGKTQSFVATVSGIANQAVVWSVTEPGGGAVTAAGIYTAPAAGGTYHVVATSQVDRTSQATATVDVGGSGTCLLNSPQPSALPAAQVLSLGTHTVGETVTFAVPAGTGSVTILQQGVEQLAARSVTLGGMRLENTVIPLTVSVDGVAYYDDRIIPPDDPADLAAWNAPPGSAIGAIYAGIPSPWTGAMTFPNTTTAFDSVNTSGGAPSGTWSVVVNDYAAECMAVGPPGCLVGDGTTAYPDGRYDMKVLLKPGVVPAIGTVDVGLYLVTDELTSTTAPGSPSVQRMLQTLGTYLGRAGLAVGTVEYVDLPAAVKARYATVNVTDLSTCGDVSTLLRMTGPGNRMNLMLVKSFSVAGIVGMDGAIPGSASVGGTVASGALVSTVDLFVGSGSCAGTIDLAHCGADFTAYVAAHEAGHFLGLYHVSESFGTLFDPVKDTPTCLCSACAQTPGNCYPVGSETVTVANCTKNLTDPASPCGGGDNLMFWLVDPVRSAGTLSVQQSSIVRANPLVR